MHFSAGMATPKRDCGPLSKTSRRHRDTGSTPHSSWHPFFDRSGRFADAESALADLEPELEAEQVREAMALAVRGNCCAELGDTRAARRLIDRAIDRSPGVPTRYLFARGMLELRLGELDACPNNGGCCGC